MSVRGRIAAFENQYSHNDRADNSSNSSGLNLTAGQLKKSSGRPKVPSETPEIGLPSPPLSTPVSPLHLPDDTSLTNDVKSPETDEPIAIKTGSPYTSSREETFSSLRPGKSIPKESPGPSDQSMSSPKDPSVHTEPVKSSLQGPSPHTEPVKSSPHGPSPHPDSEMPSPKAPSPFPHPDSEMPSSKAPSPSPHPDSEMPSPKAPSPPPAHNVSSNAPSSLDQGTASPKKPPPPPVRKAPLSYVGSPKDKSPNLGASRAGDTPIAEDRSRPPIPPRSSVSRESRTNDKTAPPPVPLRRPVDGVTAQASPSSRPLPVATHEEAQEKPSTDNTLPPGPVRRSAPSPPTRSTRLPPTASGKGAFKDSSVAKSGAPPVPPRPSLNVPVPGDSTGAKLRQRLYDQLFDAIASGQETVPGGRVGKVWRMSGLDGPFLKQVWETCDTKQRGSLDVREFVSGMLLINEELQRRNE